MLNKYLRLLAALVLAGLLVSCGGDDDDSDTQIPESYNFEDYQANIATVAHLPANLSALTTVMKAGRTPGTIVSAEELRGIYNDATEGQSLSEITTTQYKALVDVYLEELAKASAGEYTDTFPIQPEGGAWNGYLFDEDGAELEQFVEKGLFEAAMFNRAAQLLNADEITAQALDQAFAFYGADPSFPNNSNDSFGAKYAARRDNAGYYTDLKTNFLEARVAINDGRAEDAKTRARTILELWEEAMAATVANYLYATIDVVSNADATDEERAGAYHAWAEAVGFLRGFLGAPATTRRMDDLKINELAQKIRGVGYGIDAAETDVPTALGSIEAVTDMEAVIAELAQIYNWENPDIFRINDVSANGRDN